MFSANEGVASFEPPVSFVSVGQKGNLCEMPNKNIVCCSPQTHVG